MKDRHLKAGQQDDHFILLSIHLDGLPQQGFLRHSLKKRGTLVFFFLFWKSVSTFFYMCFGIRIFSPLHPDNNAHSESELPKNAHASMTCGAGL